MKKMFFLLSSLICLTATAKTYYPAAQPTVVEAKPATNQATPPANAENVSEAQAVQVNTVQMQPRARRFAFGPEIGGAVFLSDVKGFDMKPAFHLGLRTSFDLVEEFLAVGLLLSAEFVHFSESKDDDVYDSFDISTLNQAFFLEFKPVAGLFFGPYVGLSQKAYAYREDGFLSHRDKKGTDHFLLSGAFIGYNFKPGRRFHLGPRIDVINYSALNGSYVNSHTVASLMFAVKWTF